MLARARKSPASLKVRLRPPQTEAKTGCEPQRQYMKTPETMETKLKQQDIAARALHRWELAGRHHHHDLEYWLQAEAELGAALPPPEAEESASKSHLEHPSRECIGDVMAPAW